MSTELQDIREKYALYEELTRVLEDLTARELEMKAIIEALKEFRKANGFGNLGGVYAKITVTDAENFVVPVGANYFVEMPKDKVIENLSKQLELIGKEKEKVKLELDKLKTELMEVLSKIQPTQQ